MPTKIAPATAKRCKPFLLDVMVYSPEQGYKFELSVEKRCSPDNDPIWKLVFDLYKEKDNGEFDLIVHVSFTAGDPEASRGIKNMAYQGISAPQAEKAVNDVFPATKAIENVQRPTEEQKAAIDRAMNRMAVA